MPDRGDTRLGDYNWPKGPFIPHSAIIEYFNIDEPEKLALERSLVEIYLAETLLSPMLTTSIVLQDTSTLFKDLDQYKGKYVNMRLSNPNIVPGFLDVSQVIYRIENRTPINYNAEQYILQACDETLLNNARIRISNTWPCANPGDVAAEVLACVGAKAINTDPKPNNRRTYQASNIHPFQIIAELADVSVNPRNDPSYLHFMTYRNLGTHHFQSMQDLAEKRPMWNYYYNEKGLDSEQIGDPHNIMQYSFPCEFDLLSDIMNGLDVVADSKPSMVSVNPQTGEMYLVNGSVGGYGCGGIGGVINNSAFTNLNSAEDDGCETNIEQYLHLRPPRLALLQPDKVSLKLIVPFNPLIHAGDVIEAKFYAKRDDVDDYATGNYLIVNLVHNIKPGATMYATTTLECVARSVSQGEV